MADTITTNFHWVKPEPHASPLDWGVKLNADLDLIDAKVFALDSGYNATNQFVLNKATVAAGNPIYGQFNSVGRWAIEVGNADAETGSNNGSNYSIYRYNDAGTFIDAPLTIYRANGNAVFTGQINSAKAIVATESVNINSATQANLYLCDAAGSGKGQVYWRASDNTVVLQQSSGGAYVQVGATFCTINKPTTVTGAFTAGSLSTSGTIFAAGAATINGTLTAGSLSTSGAIFAAGAATFANTIAAPQIACNNASGTSSFYGVTATFLNTSGNVTIAGNLTVSGVFSNPSDARLKTVINDYDGGLNDLLQLRPVVYRYNNDDTHRSHVGLVAQEAELAMPELVSMGSGVIDGVEVDDLRSLDSTAIIFALINSVKELKAEIEELKKR